MSVYRQTAIPLAAYTSSQSAAITQSSPLKYAHVIVTVTAFASGSFTPIIQGIDPASGNPYPLLTGAAITGTGQTVLVLGPGITFSANQIANDFLPQQWQITMQAASNSAATFSVGVDLAD